MKKYFLAITAILLFWGEKVQAQTPAFITDSLDHYIEQGMKDWNIPGLSISIVKDGKVVTMKGYGVRDVKTKQPIDENTLFIIASNTKLVTGTAMANLEHTGKLSLNDKVTKYLPSFKMYDKNTTDLITIRDLLSHRMGLKVFHGDFSSWNSTSSRQQVMSNIQLLKPTAQFRQEYGYSNSAFVTAGEIIPVVTGKTWQDYVQETIITPLGMTNTYPVIKGIEKRNNIAKPYTDAFLGKLTELPYDQIDNLGPAGGIVSNVKDVTKWLMMQLDSGRYEGKQILPWEVLQKTRDVNTIITSRKDPVLPAHFVGYGLGVIMSDYAGKQIYRHTGGVFGFLTNTCFIPEENLGITIMTNNDNQAFFEMLRLQIQDAYLGVPYTNRSKKALAGHKKKMEETKKEIALLEKRVGTGKPELPLKAYEGNYENELDGSISIKAMKNNKLQVNFNNHVNLTGTLEYMNNGEWLLRYNSIDYGIFKTSFHVKNGKAAAVDIRVSDYVDLDTYTYTRK